MFLQLIYSEPIQISDEAWFSQLISHATSGQEDGICNEVRARDEKCVIFEKINDGALWDVWAGFEAAHVFSLQYESLWTQYDYSH